jgi:hypothetical protein
MSSDWQDDIDRLESLGKPVGEFVVSGRILLLRLALALGLVLLGIGLIVLLVVAKGHHVHILIWGPLLAIMGVTLAIRSYRNLGLRVLIYPEGGIRFQHDRVVTFFWEEITRLWRKKIQEHWSSAWQGSLIFILEKANGETIQFDDALPRLSTLADLIQSKTLPILLSTMMANLEAGQTIDFGELVVHPLGLKLKKGTLAWEEINEIRCDGQALSIYKKSKKTNWCTLKVSEIPNFHVISTLISEIMK